MAVILDGGRSIMFRTVRSRALLVGVVASGLVLWGQVGAGATTQGPPVVGTDRGFVAGVRSDGVDSFLGVPYAKPPVGALRWEPPQRAMPWGGVRSATAYGNSCVAPESSDGPLSLHEDCLYLNVQRPAGARPGDRLPVLFFIHGGGNFQGSGKLFDGSTIVRRTGIIVVTINFRLGVLGWMGLPALTAEQGSSGDWGFQDQIAALQWAHRNVASFGGDARRVTIDGQSNGGTAMCSLMTSPVAAGLFSAVIFESGDCESQSQDAANASGEGVASSVGCTDPATQLACLRGLSAKQLLDATQFYHGIAVVGNPRMPIDPTVALHSGRFSKVPVMFGVERDEGRTFARGWIGHYKDDYVADIEASYTDSAAVLKHYPWPSTFDQFTAAYLEAAIGTDRYFVCSTLQMGYDLAHYVPVYRYEFDHRDGPGLSPDPAGYVWGAGHATELMYLWPTSYPYGIPVASTFDAGEQLLAAQMTSSWGTFVRSGAPMSFGTTPWPQYKKGGSVVSMRAGGASRLIGDAAFSSEHQCGFWATLGG